MAFNFQSGPALDDPLMGFRFGVFFLGGIGLAHPLDFRFQKVNGLSQSVELSPGGAGRFPQKLKPGKLELARGMPSFSTYRVEIQQSFDNFKFKPRNILVSILDENALPLNSWLFSDAYPTDWSLSGLDATSSQVIIESMQLAYKSIKPFSL